MCNRALKNIKVKSSVTDFIGLLPINLIPSISYMQMYGRYPVSESHGSNFCGKTQVSK